jgi:hypothetical protein
MGATTRLLISAIAATLLGCAGARAAYLGSAPLLVPNGGTGGTSFTAHGALVGEGTSAFVALSPVAGSVMFQSSSTSDPSMSATPTLGVAASTPGTLTLENGNSGGAGITLQNVGATSNYSYNFPTGAGNTNQVETSQGGGSTANSWQNIAALLTAGTGITLSGTTNVTIAATAAPTISRYTTSNATVTLASTNMQRTGFDQSGTKASTIDLPPSPTANTLVCVKDDGNNFNTNDPTVKTTDSSTIDHTAGSTGYVMPAQQYVQICFLYDSTDTNWDVE